MIRPAVGLALVALAGCASHSGIRTTPQSLSPSGSGESRSFTQGPEVAAQAAGGAARATADVEGNEYNRNAEIYRGVFAGALAVNTAR